MPAALALNVALLAPVACQSRPPEGSGGAAARADAAGAAGVANAQPAKSATPGAPSAGSPSSPPPSTPTPSTPLPSAVDDSSAEPSSAAPTPGAPTPGTPTPAAPPPSAPPPSTPSPPASRPGVPSPATRANVEATKKNLEDWIHAGASETNTGWALAHGLLAYGASHRAADGRLAIDVLVHDFTEKKKVGDRELIHFPVKGADGHPIEPHRHLIVKSILEAGVPLTRSFKMKTGETVTLERLARDAESEISKPVTEPEWRNWGWSLSTLLLVHPKKDHTVRVASGPKLELSELALDTLRYVEAQQGFLADLMAVDRPDLVQKQKQLIYSHTCGGIHLIQAAVRGAIYTGDKDAITRARKQLEVLVFRWRAEREIYRKMLASAPEYRVLLLTQELKFYGHVLETLALASSWGVYPADARSKDTVARIASDLGRAVEGLRDAYAQLDKVRRDRDQTYLDLIGDGCHAVRGLRQSLVAFFPPS